MSLNEFTLPDGSTRRLGNVAPPDNRLKASWTHFRATPDQPVIPRDQWPALVAQFPTGPDHPHLPPVHDQDGVGQCNCDDTTAIVESIRMTMGLPYVQLSAADLYARINGGSDNGSMLEDAMSEMLTRGVGTAATCGTLWHRGMRTAPDAERARFRVLEAYLCPTFDHCMSAVLMGFRLSTGIPWYDNYTPDSDGWLPAPRGSSGGHAIFGYKPAARNGKFGIWHQNSWTASFGIGGRFVIPETAYTQSVGGWWAVRSVTDEGGVVPT